MCSAKRGKGFFSSLDKDTALARHPNRLAQDKRDILAELMVPAVIPWTSRWLLTLSVCSLLAICFSL